jgi:hypothetical protein
MLFSFFVLFLNPGDEMVDMLDLGSNAAKHVGSSPILGILFVTQYFKFLIFFIRPLFSCEPKVKGTGGG